MGRTVTLKDSHIHEGVIYGPGTVEVPDNFPTTLKGFDAPNAGESPRASFIPATHPDDETPDLDAAKAEREDAITDARDATLERAANRAVAPLTETGDRFGAAVTGLHTVTHPEQGHGDVRTFRQTNPPGAVPERGARKIPNPTGAPAPAAPTGRTAHSREALEDLTVADLETLAAERGVTVTRGDGEEGKPRKADYIDALAGGK